MDGRAKPVRDRVTTSTVQVAMPVGAYRVLAALAADSGATKAEVLRRKFPVSLLEQRAAAQECVADAIHDGLSITDACATAGIARSLYEAWRLNDPQFRDRL